MPEIYVVGGCNGSGKTTFALNIFPNIGNIEIADYWQVYDNSSNNQLIAFFNNQTTTVIEANIWNQITNYE